MSHKILSTARPTRLRVAGFLCLALGGLLLGLGSLQRWAIVGFPQDTAHRLDVPTNGVDIWEGKLALAAGILILVGVIVLRLVGATRRRAIALGVLLLGVAATAAALEAWARSDEVFGGAGSLDRIARARASRLGKPFAEVLAQLQAKFATQLQIRIGSGMWLTMAGGVLGAAGGILSLAWAKRQSLPTDAPPATDGVAPAGI